WSHEWGGSGSSGSGSSGSSGTYRGTGPLSEPELQSYTSYVQPYLDRAVAFLDIHSSGQLILSPWSYTRTLPAEIEEYNRLGELMSAAIQSMHGESYTAGPGSTTLYLAAGAAKDWGHVSATAWSWTLELRPDHGGGHVL